MAETDVEPRITEDERERMQELLELMAQEELDEAAELVREHGGPAASALFDFTAANIHFQREELDQAAAACQVAVDKYPKFRRAWRMLGLIRVRQGAFAEALPALTRVIELGGGDAYTYGGLGYAYSNVENYLSAESAYRMANLLDPASVDWQMGLAFCFFGQQRFADAAALCDNLIAKDAERADYWLLQANAFIGLGQPLRAAQNYEMVERLGGSTPESLANLGDIYATQELYDLCADAYLAALAKEGPQSGALGERALRAANALTGRGALGEAHRLVDALDAAGAGELDPEGQKDLLRIRARLAVAEGAKDEELRTLEEIVRLDPLDGEALILLGQAERQAGDVEQAIFYFERAANMEEFEADAKVRHAQVLAAQGKYAEALPLLRRAQALDPRDNVADFLEQIESAARGAAGGAGGAG